MELIIPRTISKAELLQLYSVFLNTPIGDWQALEDAFIELPGQEEIKVIHQGAWLDYSEHDIYLAIIGTVMMFWEGKRNVEFIFT